MSTHEHDEALAISQHRVDRTGWPPGTWDKEPDRLEWEHAGFPCLIIRNDYFGHLCGYVALPPEHALHGVDYPEIEVGVHGGLTYAGPCRGAVCHIPKPGQPADVWWIGFDCLHCFDLAPGMQKTMIEVREKAALTMSDEMKALLEKMPDDDEYSMEIFQDVYRSVPYVQQETNDLAEQLARLGSEIRRT